VIMGGSFTAIVNGAAGGGKCRARADLALGRLRRAGFDLDVRMTEGPGHGTELAREAYAAGQRRFLSVGGDGTSYEVINGIFPRTDADRVELGLLPLGTGNSFLRDFGITTEEGAIAALTRGAPKAIDVVRADHRDGVIHYMNLLGLGFLAEVGGLTNRRFTALGPAGYVAGVFTKVITLAHHVDPIRIDGSEVVDARPSVFVSFSNSKYTGGAMKMAPHADPSDGKLDIIRAGALDRRGLLAAFPKVFSGTHVEHPLVDETRASTVEFVSERAQDVMVDGEVLVLALRRLTVLPGALEVFV